MSKQTIRMLVTEKATDCGGTTYDSIVWVGERTFEDNNEVAAKRALKYRAKKAGHCLPDQTIFFEAA